MHVPAWLDVALEGGALELQRALVRYRALRRTLSGDWRPRALAVAEQCAAAARTEAAVETSLARALKRARHDPNAGAATHLALAVERERRRVADVLFTITGADATLPDQLAHLEDVARDEGHLEAAWHRFRAERLAWTLGLALAAASLPVTSWWFESFGGAVPILIRIEGLREPWIPPVLIAAALLFAICRLRLQSWDWLGLRFSLLGAAGSCAVCAASALVGSFSVVAGLVAITACAIAVLTMMPLLLLKAMWLLPRAPLVAPLR